jgi:hypothetical protein
VPVERGKKEKCFEEKEENLSLREEKNRATGFCLEVEGDN